MTGRPNGKSALKSKSERNKGNLSGSPFIRIACEGSRWVELKNLVPLQDNLKTLSEADFQKGTRSLQKYGFSFPFFVWDHKGKTYVLDGHQRDRILKKHLADGKALPKKFPAVTIQAKNVKEAREKILLLTSQYGKYTMESVYEFMHDSQIELNEVDQIMDFPQFNWERFKAGYFDDGNFEKFDWQSERNGNTVNISELKPHPLNYRTHPDDQIEHLMASIKENGIFRNIVIAKDGTILAGHGITEAARRLGMDKIPVTRLPVEPMDPRALKVLTGDNEAGRAADVDDRALADMLKKIVEEAGNLDGTGFDKMKLAALAFVTRTEVGDKNEAAHWVGMPEFDMGQEAQRLMVFFKTVEDRDLLLKKLEIKNTIERERLMSCWWPPRETDDLRSVKFVGPDEAPAGDPAKVDHAAEEAVPGKKKKKKGKK